MRTAREYFVHELPEMDSLLGGYFNYDWNLDYETPEQVLDAYKRENGSEYLLELKKELEYVLQQDVSEEKLNELLFNQFVSGFPYEVDWTSAKEWLQYIHKYMFSENDN
jgi:hypothetical protein